MIGDLMNKREELNKLSELAHDSPKSINSLISMLNEISTHDSKRDNEITRHILTQIRDMIDPMISRYETSQHNHVSETNTHMIESLSHMQSLNQDQNQCIGYDDVYNTIVSEHNKKIHPTSTFIKFFIKDIIENVRKYNNNERPPKNINVDEMTTSLLQGLPETMELDNFYNYISEYLIAKSSIHYYYDAMAAFVAMRRIHNITSDSFLITAKLLQNNLDVNGAKMSILSDEIYDIISKNHQKLQAEIDYSRDYGFDYFGIKTLERSYLYKLHFSQFKIIERPQHMWMRVSLGIHGNDIESAIETYHLLSQKFFTHATPTLFNSGSKRPQMSSCFLQSVDDNIGSIFETVKEIAFTSKWSGGIGLHITSLRARGSLIRGTNGVSSGVVPFCILLNKLAKYINQGGKRNGSIACYLEPYHADIYDFCDLRKNTGNDDNRARDLFLALWVPSLFIQRVKEDGMWSLMCPDMCPGLNLVHSEEFNKLYTKYESEHKYLRQVKARDLWKHILETQSETGFPYILYKDNANAKSNQKNLGTIRSSNLCAEIIQYSDESETATCNLCSICLPKYISTHRGSKVFDHKKLIHVVRVIVRNLNKIIDRNYYPTVKTKRSNTRHRPMGIGVQGLADVYNIMGFGFDSPKAFRLNKEIFETIYYACIDESKELAKKYGTYQTFKGSPASMGQLQFHMWGLQNDDLLMKYDWNKLVQEVKTFGLRNSLLTALMPTASTSQIMGNSECIEPYMKNIFKRSTLAGEFIVVNKNLMKDLIDLKLWNDDMRKRLIIEDGSVQNIDSIPENIKEIYKTAFEIKQMHLVRQSADRGCFIDQSQSFNLFLKEPNFDILTSALIESHDLGCKTGMYYYRSCPAVNPISFGIDVDDIQRLTGKTNVIDMIQDSYDIDQKLPRELDQRLPREIDSNDPPPTTNLSDPDVKKEDPMVYVVKKKPIYVETNTNIEPIGEVKMCKWKPGMRLEDCLECGS
jgi:ribonucleoside-diphosphate reductase alpha chain